MTTGFTRRATLLIGASLLGSAGLTLAQGRPMRKHTATGAEALDLGTAGTAAGQTSVQITVQDGIRQVVSNGIPDHPVGSFPNSGNPNPIAAQSCRFQMPASPGAPGTSGAPGTMRAVGMNDMGVAVNGVPFDPGVAEYWQGDRQSGWQYEALGGAVPLGLDANYAHVQPNGAYHYHGLPVGLMQVLGWDGKTRSPLIGWAADGYPIYAVSIDGHEMQPSWRLKSGQRPGGDQPGGAHDGAFVQDYDYVAGSGDLDAANGTFVTTDDYPDGTYAYFLTRAFPVIPRMLAGQPDPSFSKRR